MKLITVQHSNFFHLFSVRVERFWLGEDSMSCGNESGNKVQIFQNWF